MTNCKLPFTAFPKWYSWVSTVNWWLSPVWPVDHTRHPALHIVQLATEHATMRHTGPSALGIPLAICMLAFNISLKLIQRRNNINFTNLISYLHYLTKTRSIWKMLDPFATASRHYIAIHQVSLLLHTSYSYNAGGVRCPRQRQRVTEGTAMASTNSMSVFMVQLSLHKCSYCKSSCS